MKAVITVIGTDKIGIIAKVTSVLSDYKLNVLDISQTILDEYFTMIMIVDLEALTVNFEDLSNKLDDVGNQIGLSIKVQHQDIFNAMYNI